jgi:hypothetical protein
VYETTHYFLTRVQRDRPYATVEVCIYVIENALRRQVQQDGRIRHWAYVPGLGRHAVRVVTLGDGTTIHNAFFDRRFHP